MEKGKYLAGFAKLDITPFLGVRMIDLGKDAKGTGLLDPMMVRAVAFSDGEKQAVFMVLDNWIGVPDFMGFIPRLAEALDLPEDCINYCATHSHATPCISIDETYDAFVYHRMKNVITLALNDLKPVTDVQWAEDRAEGMAFTRRYRMKNGKVYTNPVRAERQMVGFAEPFDDTMRVVRIFREDAKEIVLINCQAHPGNGGSLSYTASYPGLLCTNMERIDDSIECMYFNGAEGDMITWGPDPIPADHNPTLHDIDYSKRLAKIAESIRQKAVSTGCEGFSYGKSFVNVKTKRTPENVEEAKRILALVEAGKKEEIDADPRIVHYKTVNARNIMRLEKFKQDSVDVPLTAVSFCGLCLAGIAGEPFSEVGVKVREASKYPATCVCCFANGGKGYFPTEEAYNNGGYEPHNTAIAKGCAEKITEATINLIESL